MRLVPAVLLFVALATLGASAQTVPSAPDGMLADLNARIQITLAASDEHRGCRELGYVRGGMYAAQAADALATGAAVKHGAIGKTPFGTTDVPVSLVTQAAFDLVVGAFTRRMPCAAKDLIDASVGASAITNAVQAGS